MNKDQIVIVGGGLQGLATAYTLMSRGEDVLILERDSDVASSASFANAGMLTPSQSMPWNSPSDILQILSGFGKKDSPMALSPKALPSLFLWGIKFLLNSTPKKFDKITNKYFLSDGNKENLSFVLKIAPRLKLNYKKLIKTINKFKGLDFRQQIIFDKKNLTIINDSKSTSFASSENILENLNNIVDTSNYVDLNIHDTCNYIFQTSNSLINYTKVSSGRVNFLAVPSTK